MRSTMTAAAAAVFVLAGAGLAAAQDWKGPYVGGTIGAVQQRDDASEVVRFDTNLDATFNDTVRTIAGVDAFSPGFCGGLAVNAVAANGCTDDKEGVDVGGRAGYDWRFGPMVVGGLVDVTRTDATDSVTAFSTTPAFYSFTRALKMLTALRGRVGVGMDRLLIYGTGGGAWGRVDQSFTTSNAVNTFVSTADDDGDMVWGYQAGAGVEVRVAARWTVVGEYLYTSLDDRDASSVRAQGPAPVTNPFTLVNGAGTDLQRAGKFELQTVKVGLNYRF